MRRPIPAAGFLTAASLALVTLAPRTAAAQEDVDVVDRTTTSGDPRLGVGMYATIGTPGFPLAGGVAIEYDARAFRIAGLLATAINTDGADAFGIGARFLYAMHKTRRADFSLGLGLAFGHILNDPGNDITFVLFEGVGQIRVFLVDNVALTGTLGVGVAVGEDSVIFSLGGQLTGQFGLTYYF